MTGKAHTLHRFCALFFITGVLLLTGCAGQVNMRPTLTPETQLSASEGLVVARIINASAYPLPFNYLTVTPENLNENSKVKPERLSSLPYPSDTTTVFASPLKQGSYALSSIMAFHMRGDYWYSRGAGADAKFGTFDVKPGQVTDLGTIVYYPKPQEDRYMDTLLRVPEPTLGEVLEHYFPFYNFDPALTTTWNEDGTEDERQNLFVSIAQNPVTYRERYEAPDGTLHFLSSLGVIMTRSPQGEWSLDAVDTNLPLNSIAQNANGDVLVGGSGGKVFFKASGDDWQDISLSSHHQNIMHVSFTEGMPEVISATETQVSVYRAQDPSELSWSTLNTFSTLNGWLHAIKPPVKSDDPSVQDIMREQSKNRKKPRAKRIVSLGVETFNEQHFVSVTVQPMSADPAFRYGDTETFNFDPKTWVVDTGVEAPDIDITLTAGAVKLGVEQAGFWSWDGMPTYSIYQPGSDTWTEISTKIKTCGGVPVTSEGCEAGKKVGKDSFRLGAIPWFATENEGIVFASFSDYDFWSGERSSETLILKTQDGGKTWTDTGFELPKDFCSTVIPEVKDLLLVACKGATGDFYQSADMGQTWEHVRQHENF